MIGSKYPSPDTLRWDRPHYDDGKFIHPEESEDAEVHYFTLPYLSCPVSTLLYFSLLFLPLLNSITLFFSYSLSSFLDWQSTTSASTCHFHHEFINSIFICPSTHNSKQYVSALTKVDSPKYRIYIWLNFLACLHTCLPTCLLNYVSMSIYMWVS